MAAAARALVCPTSRSQPVAGMPGRLLPAVSAATDLNSLIKAVNTLNELLQQLTVPAATNGLPQSAGTAGLATLPGGYVLRPGAPEWSEVDRITEPVTVTHKDVATRKEDKGQRVEVDRIRGIEFGNVLYQESFVWQYKR